MVAIKRNNNYTAVSQQNHHTGGASPCVVCGKPIHNIKRASWIHVVAGGAMAAEPGDPVDPWSDCGYQPVGPECAKQHPELPYLPPPPM